MSAHPIVATVPPAVNGAIFQEASYQPLFQDRRARRVGDTLTVQINEKVIASKKSASTSTRKGDTKFAVPEIQGLPGKGLQGGIGARDDRATSSRAAATSGSDNTFTGTITLTVIEVLPNGNLVVSGEKQIGINQGSEFVRVSGVVNPINILPGQRRAVDAARRRAARVPRHRLHRRGAEHGLARPRLPGHPALLTEVRGQRTEQSGPQ